MLIFAGNTFILLSNATNRPFLPLIVTDDHLKSKILHSEHWFSTFASSNLNQNRFCGAGFSRGLRCYNLSLNFALLVGTELKIDPLDFRKKPLVAREANR